MKTKFKNILALLILTLFSLTVNSQVYNHNTRVKISTVNQLMSLDGNTKLIVHDSSNNELKYVTATQLQAIVSNFQGYDETGTRAGGDLIVTIGDYDDTNNGIKIQIDDSNESISFFSTNELNFSNDLRVENQGTGFYGTLNMGLLTANQNYFFPNSPGTIALTSDITPQSFNDVLTEGNTATQDVIIDGFRNNLIVQDLANNDKSQVEANRIQIDDLLTLERISLYPALIEMDNGSHTGSIRADNLTQSTTVQLPKESGTLSLNTATGGALYIDGTYTVGSPLTITQGSRVKLTCDNNTIVDGNVPPDFTVGMWDATANKLLAVNDKDRFVTEIRFKAKNSVNNGYFDIEIDISGTQGVIDQESKVFTRNANTEQSFKPDLVYFSGTEFISNGGEIYINAINGDLEIYDIQILPTRIHKGY